MVYLDEKRSDMLLLIISQINQYHISYKRKDLQATHHFTTERFEHGNREPERNSRAGNVTPNKKKGKKHTQKTRAKDNSNW
jgi:hypothetical protein